MKILWLCNILLPQIAKELKIPTGTGGGWMSGCADKLLETESISLTVCFPVRKEDKPLRGTVGRLGYFGFPMTSADPARRNPDLPGSFKAVLDEIKPDAVHIWGTEYSHTLDMTDACEAAGLSDRTIINIQGLCMPYSKHYYAGLPCGVINGFSLRDALKLDNLRRQRDKFIERGELETRALKKAAHIIGRTDWDRACTYQVNPRARYHFCNEILRGAFYTGEKWSPEGCERHSIFLSQGTYPIKGLHFALEALEIIACEFPDARMYVAGPNVTDKSTFMKKIKRTRYSLYIDELLERNGLRERVTFLGPLNEQEMRGRYLRSHVFVSPSSIENSPNSVGEAMILGVPVVASDVGGVKNMMTHDSDGFIYQYDAAYMLAYYVCRVFGDDGLALKLSGNAIKSASATHDRDANIKRVLEIYREVCGGL